ncbi:MAG: metallopeptidase TldD-related protein, partial [Candidatus Hodarchaeota archaeon]
MSLLDTNWDLLRDCAHKAINKVSKKQEVTHAEAFFTGTQLIEVNIRDSEIQSQNKLHDLGIGFRVVTHNNKVGFTCTNTLNEKIILDTAEKAFSIARVSSEVQNFSLPETTQLVTVDGFFDSHVNDITIEDVVDIAKRTIKAAEDFDNRVIAKRGVVSCSSGWRGIINSLGVDFSEKETKTILELAGSGQDKGEVTGSTWDAEVSRKIEFKPEQVGENVGKGVIEMFGKKSLPSFQGTAIFGPSAVSYQLNDVLIDALKGNHVISGRSNWTKKLTQKITSESLTIID